MRGIVSYQSFERDQQRSVISLQLCCMSWVYEFISIASMVLTPLLQRHGAHNLYLIDPAMMFVVIPFIHLMNDEDTKQIILEEDWYQGIKHLLGLRDNKTQENRSE